MQMYQQLMARSARAASIVAAGLMLWAGPHNAQAQCEFEWSDGFNVPGANGAVLSTTIFDDGRGPALYVGGGFSSVGGASASGIARRNGRWSPLGNGVGGSANVSVGALAVFDDGRGAALYVGGQFETAGQMTASNIARWGCSDGCDPCDMSCDGGIDALDIEPFLDLLFGGGRPCNACTGDVNGDGNIDASDIEPFLNWLFP